MRRGRTRLTVMLSLLISLVVPSAMVPSASAAEPPSLRLFAADSSITVERSGRGRVFVEPGAWITPVGGTFELRATRPDYDTPVSLTQVDAVTHEVLRTLPAELLEGWFGLKDFIHYSVKDADGTVIDRVAMPFCANSYNRSRLSDESPLVSRYPYFCQGGPFTKGMVWGIDQGWATTALGEYYGLGWKATRRNYTVRVWIDPEYVGLLGIAAGDAEALIHVTVVDRGDGDGHDDAAATPAPPATPFPRVPDVTAPDPESLPDLVALPGWGMATYARRGHDYLAFNATEWNAGPGTFIVEGFRQQDQEEMDAFQYFLVDGQPIGRSQIGSFEFHQGGGHNHWHFQEFTEYSLLDAASQQVLISGKQSWCLVNTDAIDLAAPNAEWNAFGDLGTSCGGPGALWIREVLDVGYGDTYSQYVSGQAFDITDLPNGTYHVRVHVNPADSILESSSANNIEDRVIRLKGTPGNRRVVVPPWHGIDTENYCYYCF